MFRGLKDFVDALFKPPSVTDNVVQRTHAATAEVRMCDAAIDKARYQKHMALHELMALEHWNHGIVKDKL